jgi:hypothetical protein
MSLLDKILLGVAAWILGSIPLGLIVGRVLRHGTLPEPLRELLRRGSR